MIRGFSLILSFSLFLLPGLKAAESIEPIFYHTYQSQLSKMLQVVALEYEISPIFQQQKVEEIYRDLEERVPELLQGSSTILGDLEAAYMEAALLTHFFLSYENNVSSIKKLVTVRGWMSDLTSRYINKSDQVRRSDRDEDFLQSLTRAHYFNLILQIANHDSGKGVVQKIARFQNTIDKKSRYYDQSDLILGVLMVQTKQSSQVGIAKLHAYKPKTLHQVLTLEVAKALYSSGIDDRGIKHAMPDPEVFFRLDRALKPNARVSSNFKSYLIDTLFFIWTKAYRDKFNEPPFDYGAYIREIPASAYIESLAIQYQNMNKSLEAAKIYEKLLTIHAGDAVANLLLQRAWNLYVEYFKAVKNPQILWQGYRRLREILDSQNQKDDLYVVEQKQRQLKDLNQSYLKQIYSVISQQRASKLQDPKSKKAFFEAVSVGESTLDLIKDPVLTKPFRFALASLYSQKSLFNDSVRHYLELAKSDPQRMLSLAIADQNALANWPKKPVFNQKIPDGNKRERVKLVSIQTRFLQLYPKAWTTMAQQGLLLRSLGQDEQAYRIWEGALKEGVSDDLANEFAGQLLVHYQTKKDWLAVIDLESIVARLDEPLTYQLKPISWARYHSEALYQYARTSMKPGRYNRAVRFFQNFLKKYPDDKRVPAVYHSMALAELEQKNYLQGLVHLRYLVTRYPNYPERSNILKVAGRIAFFNEQSFQMSAFFLENYLKDYANAKDIPITRDQLGQSYVKLKLYRQAIETYFQQFSDPRTSQALKISAAANIIDVGVEYMQIAAAIKGAQLLSGLINEQHPLMVKVYVAYAYESAQLGDAKKIAEWEQKLMPFAAQSLDARNYIAYVRVLQADSLRQRFSDDAQVDHEGKLAARLKYLMNRFVREKKAYQNACIIGPNQWCAVAHFQSYLAAKEIQKLMDEMKAPSHFTQEQQKQFLDDRNKYADMIADQASSSRQEAYKLAVDKKTMTPWRERILNTFGH